MNTKTLCGLSNYFAITLALSVLAVFIPHMGIVFMTLNLSVSAIYLEIFSIKTWVLARTVLEATKLPVYYDSIIKLQLQMQSAKTVLVAITAHDLLSGLDKLPHARAEQLMYVFDSEIMKTLSPFNYISGFTPILLSFLTTYGGIFLIHYYLGKQGFYRRLIL